MQNALKYLEIIRDRGERRLELRRVYRHIHNRELFLIAYAKLYANAGATTAGIDPADTVDGMSLARIDRIISDLQKGEYEWKPARRTYMSERNGKLRPLGIPTWNDKLLQQVLQMILSAYYEPQFSDCSHGFRAGRSCHTALRHIIFNWKGTKWFIKGDIKGCFDNINHQILMGIIARSIKDDRLLKLLREMLEAGYLEDWVYNRTYSGTPQGGIISPLLANIYLNELDTFIEKELIPQYNNGDRRRPNPEYARLSREMHAAQETGDVEQYVELKRERGKLPYGDPNDPNYRRLKYVRYADDFILGFTGPMAEAEQIKQRIADSLSGQLKLELSQEKMLVTHATNDVARFLGYNIKMGMNDDQKWEGRRSNNGTPLLSVPREVIQSWKSKRMREGKPYHRTELINNSDYDIVTAFNIELQGLVNYYLMAYDVAKLYEVKYVYMQSLVKTLATKHKKRASWVYRKYRKKLDNGLTAIVVEVEREGLKPLVAMFGAKPIRFYKGSLVVPDILPIYASQRNELLDRLLADKCELCGSTENVEVHHIRKLADIKRRFEGRNKPPEWVVNMMNRRRKTLVVCGKCHKAIHQGTYDGPKL